MADEAYTLPPSAAPANHGHTRASWTLVVGVLLGALVIGVGLAIGNPPLWITGLAVVVGALIASMVMRSRGLGQPLPDSTRRDWYAD
ncbi:MAG: hypothetical protein GX427_02225 [Actinomycetales bacterium]|nr:hypothetical protein [Actinomycetales bacterium]